MLVDRENIWIQISPEIARMLLFLVLYLSRNEGKPHTNMCTRIDPFQMSYGYYKAGDLIIGAISTRLAFVFDEIPFTGNPNTIPVHLLQYVCIYIPLKVCIRSSKKITAI